MLMNKDFVSDEENLYAELFQENLASLVECESRVCVLQDGPYIWLLSWVSWQYDYLFALSLRI